MSSVFVGKDAIVREEIAFMLETGHFIYPSIYLSIYCCYAGTWHVHCGYGGRGDQGGGRLLLYGQRGHGIPRSFLTGCRRGAYSRGEQAR